MASESGPTRQRIEVEAAMRRAKEHAIGIVEMADQCYSQDPDWGVHRRTWIHVSEAALVLSQTIDIVVREMRQRVDEAAKKG